MTAHQKLSQAEIRAALAELDLLSREEYGLGLNEVLLDPSPVGGIRIQRLVGIVLKRPFAREGPKARYSLTDARRSWPWADQPPDARSQTAPKELAVLNLLRMPGPWNEREPVAKKDAAPVDWDQFKSDVEHERGLFKILALYVDDKLKKRKRRTLQQYMKAEESRRFAAGLDLATVAFDWAVISPLMSIVGIPTVAVGVALVGVQYGYRRLTDTDVDRVGDEFS